MPSSATITAFYNFTANTKARASHVQNNFDVFRGHLLPISPSTATSADNSYDLGSFEYRWRNGYVKNSIYGATSTSYASIYLDSATTGTELIMAVNGTEKARINSNGLISTNGRSFGLTTTALPGQMAISNGISTESTFNYTVTSTPIAGSTLTITTLGRKIEISGIAHNFNTSIASYVISFASTPAIGFGAVIGLVRSDGSGFQSLNLIGTGAMVTTTAETPSLYYTPSNINFSDIPSAGTYTYYLTYRSVISGGLKIQNFRLSAIELY